MHMRGFGAHVALLWGLLTSAGAQELPQWLLDAKAREARLAAPVEVLSEDGWLRTRVPGEVKHKVVLEQGSYSLNVALDGGVIVSCEVLPESRDLADFLVKTAEVSFKHIETLNGTVEARAVEASDAGVVGPHAYLSLQWLYRANRNGEKRVGALKQYAADLGDRLVYCANDDLGYVKSFKSVAQTLTGELRTDRQPTSATHFREVSVVSLDGQHIGVATTTMTRDAEGDTRVLNKSAMLLQRLPGQLVSQDVFDVQWVRPDGSLINASQGKASGGQPTEDMSLKLDDRQRWRASGTLHGKPVDVELAGEPRSFVMLARDRAQMLAQADPVGRSTEARSWSSLDLTRLLPTRSTVLAAAGPGAYKVREEIGGLAIEAVLDQKTGTMRSARVPLGPRVMNFERILQQGDF